MSEFPGYAHEHEDLMRFYCTSLPEGNRRRYPAVEALKIGPGRITHVA